ncbi:Protein of unknown function [Bacillus mycoides]|uniref:Uncharacterized protein n=1 Tax=Bacillus mycoides TaxID=1405 RepID=A0A1G4ECU4_BACMY|nr:Protein of unknown function [Bacillus mycoides]
MLSGIVVALALIR